MKCISEDHTQYVIVEVHRGICGMHTRGRNMATQVIHVGYYWPIIQVDYVEYIKKYKEHQEFNNIQHAPLKELHSLTSPWPFDIWGMDILSPFLVAKGQIKFLLVANYFTKWIEETLATIMT